MRQSGDGVNILAVVFSCSFVVGVYFKSGYGGVSFSGNVPGEISGQFIGIFSSSGQF